MSSLRASALLAVRCRLIANCNRFASKAPPSKELKFSETAAYEGYDRLLHEGHAAISGRPWQPTYYDTKQYQNKKLLSVILSSIAVIVYFAFLREKSDIDEIVNAPPHKLTANLERKRIKMDIEDAKKAGKDTSLLEAELAYVDVKEAAIQAQFEKHRTY
ncbi:Protein F10E7.6 [Aphelenchoides avenae]|nr:Protein F10E7.6 [Aphelenchus avenae]